ncbi:putative phenylpyruvate tautomerase [Basidiobolus meristosporus CBS 931.73]|uniref:L-dopachrome isomerase n=1 Tax=Basidiobolus meristosporus CBS 931.73 TaxID=1314790 RepID=A0A1Y1ZAC0_9FUNG|nr:putative phenylpyruvate tautomerase [Basidiobolus meristosporus CBS 931.73]|eukprot:ORY07064.1 putative phenylpyruvate tautomerase [Basidiobolus meristosporus CBS 931.73]
MPILEVKTNVPAVDEEAFLKKASSLVAKLLNKPESYVEIVLQSNVAISFGGSTEPAAFVRLYSIGGLGLKENKAITKDLSALMEESFGINASRMYTYFADIERQNTGFGGTTFA